LTVSTPFEKNASCGPRHTPIADELSPEKNPQATAFKLIYFST
jgi:hypothetical protein